MMGKKVRDVIEFLDYEELLKLKNDLNSGGFHLLNLVNSKLKEVELSHKSFCSYCGSSIDLNKTQNYTLVFGPYDFRKKATFCGLDCMESFVDNLKLMRDNKEFTNFEQRLSKNDDDSITKS